jgi:SAM-dependent methyltransferase
VYDQPGSLYDLTYAHKDYAAESAWVTDAVRSRAPDARTLLDVACGTGAHLEHLRDDFDAEGLDLLDEFVTTAAARAGVPVHQGDMVDFDLGRHFDAVVCLFSAIGYASDVDGAVASMARHLAPGGVLVVEPWFTPDQWLVGHIHVLDNERDGQRLLRMTHSTLDGNRSIMEFHYLVGGADGIEHRTETHAMTLFTDDEYRAAFRAAGLDVEVDEVGPDGRGAYIGTRS